MNDAPRQRIDLWLWRARFVKTRAAAARLVAEGGVRLMHNGSTRLIDKPSVEVATGDVLVFQHRGVLLSIAINTLPARRGPATEARGLYSAVET